MERTIYMVYKNGEFMDGQTWNVRDTAIAAMEIEMECEIDDMKRARPDSQFTMSIGNEEGVGTIDEYYYDENYEEDCWNFDVSTYKVKEYTKKVNNL